MPTCPNGHASDAADFCSVCGVEMNAAAPPAPGPVSPAPVFGNPARPAAGACPVCQAARDPAGGDFCEVCGHNFRTGIGGIPTGPDAGLPASAVGAPNPAPSAADLAGSAADGAKSAIDPANHPANPAKSPADRAPSVADRAPSAISGAKSPADGGKSLAARAESPADAAPGPAPARWELHAAVEPALSGGAPDPDAPTDQPPRLFPLDVEDALIGRRSARRNLTPEIALDGDDGVSHRHARLLRQPDGRFAVLDLGSSNGTRLNGVELTPNVLSAPLAEGDRIALGRWSQLTVCARP